MGFNKGFIARILGSQKGLCFYCSKPLRLIGKGPDVATGDHLTPRHMGGTEHYWNIVAACKPCNHRKGGRAPTKAELERKQQQCQRRAAAKPVSPVRLR